ncbi:MAG: S41 family peptidase [Alphaproteobacteria bacterium]|nr:S41 family peptidase [Alphaproteobacteria bacterium]
MNIIKIFLLFILINFPVFSSDLFNAEKIDGINVKEVSNVFADIYEKLDSVNWAGKNVGVAIENIEKLDTKAHIAATDDRIILVYGDELIANYPRPQNKDWNSYGEITTALILRMREKNTILQKQTEQDLYKTVVSALLHGIDENGKYVFSKQDLLNEDKILTSIGIDGKKDSRGNFRVSAVVKDSSADIAGIKSGDLISQINGKRISAMSDSEIESVLSGYNSGTLKLKVLTPMGNKYLTLRRASIILADADIIYRQGDENNILEIIIHKLTDSAVNIVNEALSDHKNANGVILDLRTSVGGDEKSATKLAGIFIGQQPVMRIVEDTSEEIEMVPGGDSITDLPVVVLISDTTRGTAEALASAFYENKKGVLVGTPSAGKARISSKIDLSNGGFLEIMNKSLKTGSGNMLDSRGVFPLVCLSNIRTTSQQEAFFLNVMNDNFGARDFNKETTIDYKAIRQACPVIVSGEDEDNTAIAISVKILTDQEIYNKLMDL